MLTETSSKMSLQLLIKLTLTKNAKEEAKAVKAAEKKAPAAKAEAKALPNTAAVK